MEVAPPPPPGSRIQELGDRLIVRFRPRRSWGAIAFLTFWLTFWTLGGIAAYRTRTRSFAEPRWRSCPASAAEHRGCSPHFASNQELCNPALTLLSLLIICSRAYRRQQIGRGASGRGAGSNLRLASFRAFRKRIAKRLRRFRGGRGRQGVV